MKQVYAVTPAAGQRRWRSSTSATTSATIVIVGDRKVIEEQVKGFGTLVDK